VTAWKPERAELPTLSCEVFCGLALSVPPCPRGGGGDITGVWYPAHGRRGLGGEPGGGERRRAASVSGAAQCAAPSLSADVDDGVYP